MDFNLPPRSLRQKLIFNRKNNRIIHRREEVVKAASSIQLFEKMRACNPGFGAIEKYEEWICRFQNNPRKRKMSEGRHTEEEWKEIKKRFNYTCPGCGSRGRLTKDHAISRAYGRRHNIPFNHKENIQPLCPECNQGKGDRSFSYWRDSFGKVIMRR